MECPVVIDNGSDSIRAGTAGDDAPSVVFSASAAYNPSGAHILNASTDYHSSGDAQDPRNPIQRGRIVNWDAMELVWHHAMYKELGIEEGSRGVLLTESPTCPKKDREKMAQIMFETFRVPAFYVSNQAALGIYAAGRGTGVVLSSGDGMTHAVPIFEGYMLPYAVTEVNMAGCDLTDFMVKLLDQRGGLNVDRSSARYIKEHSCSVAMEFDNEMARISSSDDPGNPYQLPNGQSSIPAHTEHIMCPEALFQPSLLGITTPSVQEAVYQSIMKCEFDLRRTLWMNIVLAGGNTLFPGFPERLDKEMTMLAPSATRLKVVAPHERLISPWIGASILGSLSSFETMSISRSEFEETGAAVVNQKCL